MSAMQRSNPVVSACGRCAPAVQYMHRVGMSVINMPLGRFDSGYRATPHCTDEVNWLIGEPTSIWHV